MFKTLKVARTSLRGGTALQALALIGAGVSMAAFAAPAAAQDYTNLNATGRVLGSNGQPISGATVTVTSDAQGFSRTATTDADGTFRVAAIPQGSYTFSISAEGYDTYVEQGVGLTQANAANQFTLGAANNAAGAGGEIVVTGRRVQISDFDRNTVGSTIQIGELATRVPVARDLTSVVLLTPGANAGDTTFGNLPSVAGSSVSENAFFVNGLNITNQRTGLGSAAVPFEFYSTIETKVGSIPAEFGRFTGAFVNATTKSGGNEFHGGVLFNWQPDDLREDAPNTLYAWNKDDVRDTKQAIFSLSGPIIKDHLFFYGFYQASDYNAADTSLTANANTSITIRNAQGAITGVQAIAPFSTGGFRSLYRLNSPSYGGKIDAVIMDGQRLEFTYFNTKDRGITTQYNVVDAQGGGYDSRVDPAGPKTGSFAGRTINLGGGESYVGRYTGQFTNWLTLSGAYGKTKSRDIGLPADTINPGVSDTSGQFSPALIGNPATSITNNTDQREFYRADADIYVQLLGNHHFRGGYDRENLTSVAQTNYTGNIFWTYLNSGPTGDARQSIPNRTYVSGRSYTTGGTFTSRNEAFYVQDAWSLLNNRLNLNIGVRNDRFENNNVAGQLYYKSGNQWAPRISASFDPIGDQRTKIYGFFGRYYLPVPTNTNIRLAGAELDYTGYYNITGVQSNNAPILGTPITFAGGVPCPGPIPGATGTATNCEVNQDGTPASTESTVARNLKSQSMDEYVVGYEQRLGQRWKVGAFGVYRKLNQSLEDIAIDAAVNNYCAANRLDCTVAAPTTANPNNRAPIWSGFHQYVLANPGAASTITLSDPVNGEATARTVDFTAAQLGYPQARRTYKAVTLTVDREFDGVWSFSGNYTFAKTIGNIEGGIRSDNGQTDSGLTTAFDQPGLTVASYGYLPTDQRHSFKAFGSYKVTDWFTFGANFNAASPRHYGCIGRVPNRVDSFAGQYGAAGFFCNVVNGQIVTDPTAGTGTPAQSNLQPTRRGTVFTSDWQTQTNVTLQFKVPADAFDATFRLDVFNLFAEKAKIDFTETGTQANGAPRGDYRYVNAYQAPRYIRLQFGVNF
ncbi:MULTISPECIES: carboxypeptidase regulatory-like domain-containing protein [unclassified Sphingomonas]|uniref:TonB-dependent receptor n=1 Tax=unclassified Sphingomonas TaxID=196159 RepID=UPI0025F2FF9B|nr:MULTISPECIES: carboxypeptidase regulatory-like domain-containing protein [unclassified Sphingomonas]